MANKGKGKKVDLDNTFLINLRALLNSNKTIDEDELQVNMMCYLAEQGVPVELYENVFNIYGVLNEEHFFDSSEPADVPKPKQGNLIDFNTRQAREPEKVEPIADAAQKTLRLKIQLIGVAKPPLWREVEVPAGYNFQLLNEVIQAVVGLEDVHLWQFGHKAYDPSLIIAPSYSDTTGYGVPELTHCADETPITAFLAKKDDKLTYLYDFGCDWTFSIKVQDVLDKPSTCARLTNWKCDMQVIEDLFPPQYAALRDLYVNRAFINKKEYRRQLEINGIDGIEWFEEMMADSIVNPDAINAQLEMIGVPKRGKGKKKK